MVPRMRGSYTIWTYLQSITHGMCDVFFQFKVLVSDMFIASTLLLVQNFLVCSSPTLGKVLCDPTPTSRQGEGEGTCRCFSAERAASNFNHFVWMDIGRILSFSDDIVSFVGMLQIHHLSPGLSLNTPDLRGVKRGINITFEVFFLQLPRWVVPSSGTTFLVMIQSPKSQV